jgi:hypothetical protein
MSNVEKTILYFPRILRKETEKNEVVEILTYVNNFINPSSVAIMFSDIPPMVGIRDHTIYISSKKLSSFNKEVYMYINLNMEKDKYYYKKTLKMINDNLSSIEERRKIRDIIINIDPVIKWSIDNLMTGSKTVSFKEYMKVNTLWKQVQDIIDKPIDKTRGIIPMCSGQAWRFKEEFNIYFNDNDDNWKVPNQVIDKIDLQELSDKSYILVD